MAQSVKHLTSAQVMISQLVSLSPAMGSVLTAQSLEPTWDSVSPSLSVPPPLVLSSLCLLKINKNIKKIKIIRQKRDKEEKNMYIKQALQNLKKY